MLFFQPYPILVTKDGKPFEILEHSITPFKQFDALIIKSENKTLGRYEGEAIKKITLPSEWGIVAFGYYKNEKLITTLQIDLTLERESNQKVQTLISDYDQLMDLVKREMESLDGTNEENSHHTYLLSRCVIEESAKKAVISKIRNILIKKSSIDPASLEETAYQIFSDLYGLGVIQALDDNPEIGEIMVNAVVFPEFRCDIYYIKGHKKYVYEKSFKDLNDVIRVFNNTIAFENKQINLVEHAIIEATRPNKDRVMIMTPYATESYSLNIRKFGCFVPDKSSMMSSGTIDQFIDDLFKVLVDGKANIGIGGKMGTGKTTMINYLLTYTPKIERKMVIASVAETDVDRVLKGHDILIGKVEEEKGFTFSKLLRASLRTTSDRVIIPESRGEEFKEIFEANLKTKGNFFTAHATDDVGFYEACVDMYMSNPNVTGETSEAIRNKLCKGIDIIIMMRQVNGKIRIKSISEVISNEEGKYVGLNQLYVWKFNPDKPNEGWYERTEHRISDRLKTQFNEMGIPTNVLKNF